jgi:hypothetical protein
VVILGSCFKMWRRIRARKLSLRRIDAASSRRLTFRFFKALASFKAHMKAIVLSADAKYGIKTLAHTAAAFATWTRRARRLVDFRRLHDVFLSRRLFVALTSWGTWARKRRESVARHAALQHDFLVRSRRRVIQTLLRKLRAEIRQRADAMAVLASARHRKAVASRALRLWSDAAARTVKLRSASASVGGAVLDRKTRSVLASWRSASRRGRAARDMQARVVARSATSAFFLWLESLDDASSTARKRRIAKVADFRRATRRAILRWTLFRSYKFKRRTLEERAATARRATSKRNLFAHWGAFVELAQAKLQSKRQAARHFYFHTLAAVAAAWRERLEVAGMKRRIGAKVRRRREKALAQRVLNLWRSALGALVEKRLFEARVGHIFDRVLMRGVLRRWGQGLVLMALSRQSKHEADVAFASLLKRRSLCALAAISRQRRLARERAFEIVEAAEGFNKRRLRLFGWRGMNAYLKRRAHVRANKLIANDFIFKLAAKRSMEGWVRYARIARRLRDRLRSHLNSRAKLSARRSLAYLRAHSIARRELKEVVFCHARRCGAAFLHEAVLAWRLRAEAKGEERAAARAAIALCDEAMRRVACAHWLRAAEAKALLRQRVAIKAQLRKTERILARVVRFASHWRSLARLRAAARSSAREEELRGAGVAAEGVARASRLSNFLAPLPSMRPMRAAPTHSGDAQPLGLFSRPLVDPSVRPIREPPRVPPFFWDDGAISRPSPFGASPPNAQTEAPPPPVRAGPLRSRPLVQRHVSAFSSTSSSPVPSRRPSLDVNSDVGSQISAISRSESAEDGVRSDDGSDVDEGEIEEIAGVLGAYEEERRRYLGMNVEYERLGGVLEAMDRGVYGGGGYESEDEEESGLTEAQVAARMRHLRWAMAESNRRREECERDGVLMLIRRCALFLSSNAAQGNASCAGAG